jgi:hypothetical protein
MTTACKMPDRPALFELQYAFAQSIRNPAEAATPEGVDERRMAVYRELFYNTIETVLANSFPVLRELTPERRWHELVRGFLIHHRARTPLFFRLPAEFVEALPGLVQAQLDPPYLVELARYEWVEMELALADAETPTPVAQWDPASHGLRLSPLARRLTFRYPVHRIGPSFHPAEPSETHLLVYRDSNDEVRFLEVNGLTAHLLESMETHPHASAEHLLRSLAEALDHRQRAMIIEGGLQTVRDLLERGALHALPGDAPEAV